MSDQERTTDDLRRSGQAYLDSYKGDWQALIADLNRRSGREGRKVVSLPPKSPHQRASRKAG